jgi:hypothetical protein
VIAIATYFLQNAKRLDLLNDNRLVAVFALCGLAAGMQVRFVVDSGSPPDHSLTVLALLVLFRFFSLDNRIGSFRRFVSPTINVHVASMIIVGAIIPTLVFIAIGKPVLRIVRDHPTLVSTASGSFVAKSTESPTINFIASVVAKSTPNDSAVISTSFTPWVNFITDRPVLLPITQTQILEVDQHGIDESLEVLESARPTLIVEELINDDGTEYGGWGSSSRSFSPWLWSYVDENYEYCARFTDGDPRGGLWGARFYVQKTPGDSAPDCDTFKSKAGFDS